MCVCAFFLHAEMHLQTLPRLQANTGKCSDVCIIVDPIPGMDPYQGNFKYAYSGHVCSSFLSRAAEYIPTMLYMGQQFSSPFNSGTYQVLHVNGRLWVWFQTVRQYMKCQGTHTSHGFE